MICKLVRLFACSLVRLFASKHALIALAWVTFVAASIGCDSTKEEVVESSTLVGPDVVFPDGEIAYTHRRLIAPNKVSLKLARWNDGTQMTLGQARDRFTREYRSRFGAIDSDLFKVLARTEENQPVALFYYPERMGAPELQSRLEQEGATDIVVRTKAPWVAFASVPPKFARSTLVHDRAIANAVWAPAKYQTSGSLNGTPAAASKFGPHKYTRTETSFNEASQHDVTWPSGEVSSIPDQFADGVKVGVLEPGEFSVGFDYGVWSGHEAFAHAVVRHRVEPTTCDPMDQNSCGGPGICQKWRTSAQDFPSGGFRCVNRHALQVSSRIAASVGGKANHAARAHLYIANGVNSISAQTFQEVSAANNELTERLEWLANEGVSIVNVSFSPAILYNDDVERTYLDALIDVYSGVSGQITYGQKGRAIFFVMASGNPFEAPELPWQAEPEVVCQSKRPLCVGGTEPTAYPSGGFLDSDLAFENDRSWGRWGNPLNTWTGNQVDTANYVDVERPDVVSHAYHVPVASTNDPKEWSWENGTSFAAPTMAGMAALLRGCVDPAGRWITPAYYISHIRNFAYRKQTLERSDEYIYPTPGRAWVNGVPLDSKAGAGITDGHALMTLCHWPEPVNGEPGESNPGEYDSDDPEFDGMRLAGDRGLWVEDGEVVDASNLVAGSESPTTGSRTHGGGNVAPFGLLAGLTSPKGRLLYRFNNGLRAGQAIRVTLASSCLTDQDGLSGVDVDLAVCEYDTDPENPNCFMVSESVNDTVEGLFEESPARYQDVRIWAIFSSDDLRNCERTIDTGLGEMTVSAFHIAWNVTW